MLSVRLALQKLGYPIPADDRVAEGHLLYTGEQRFQLLEWIFQRLLGDGAFFPTDDPNAPPDLQTLTEEERTARLVATATFLGVDASTEEVQGSGDFTERLDFLAMLVELVEACHLPDVEGASLAEQQQKDLQLLDFICHRQADVFSSQCELFPADLRAAIQQCTFRFPSLAEQLAAYQEELDGLRGRIEGFSRKHIFNLGEDDPTVAHTIRAAIDDLVDVANPHPPPGPQTCSEASGARLTVAATQFGTVYDRDFQPWVAEASAPELLGIGPAATRAVEAHRELAHVLESLRAVRAAHQALSESSRREHAPEGDGQYVPLREVVRCGEQAIARLRSHIQILSDSAVRETVS